jgi:SAM-dependent methyltransferase
VDPAEQRKRSRANWGAAAKGWLKHADAQRRLTMPVSTWMLDALGLQPGDNVLEIAAGPGDLGFMAAEMVAPGGTVLSTDFVPEMVSAAQDRAKALGIQGVRFRQVDAQSMDIDAASLDGALCRWGFMLMPDGEAALKETRRVLRPGSRLALAVWTTAEENPWSALVGREMARRGWAEPPEPGSPGQFAWGEEGALEEHLQAAGFVDYEIDSVEFSMDDPSPEAWIDICADMSRNFANAISGRAPEEVQDLREALRRAAEPYTQPDGSVSFPARSWVAWAAA